MAAAKTFGNYTLLKRLASGGMGETHLAEQLGAAGVSRRVVIKTMLPRFTADKAALEAFVQEARVCATLTHGNIAQVYEFGQVDGLGRTGSHARSAFLPVNCSQRLTDTSQ